MYSKELLKGTLKTIVLKLLSENGRMYGYEITQKVRLLTEDKIILTEGALYPVLHKLEADGYVTNRVQIVSGRGRKYYSITKTGRNEAIERSNEFTEFVQTMLRLLNPKFSNA